MITREQAFNNTSFHSVNLNNSASKCLLWRVNGKIKTWKRNPERFKIPVKHGLWIYSYITENNIQSFHLPEDCN
jgi:hypothetical protein